MKAMSRELRSWRINVRSDKSLGDLAHMFNQSGARLDQLLRTLLQVHVVSTSQAHQRVPRAMGQAEIQAVASPRPASKTVAGESRETGAETVCALAAGRAARRLDNGSCVS